MDNNENQCVYDEYLPIITIFTIYYQYMNVKYYVFLSEFSLLLSIIFVYVMTVIISSLVKYI